MIDIQKQPKQKETIIKVPETRYFKMSYQRTGYEGTWYCANVLGKVCERSFMEQTCKEKHPTARNFGRIIEIPRNEAPMGADQRN